jgi:PhzF family phenazine biosynthesis protein
MEHPNLLHIDAFAESPFTGNPAAVVLDANGAPGSWMQAFAAEMNLSETAFLERCGARWRIRWFTPALEVDLCGHATLAAAHALWECGRVAPGETIRFESRGGPLEAAREGALIWLDFPAQPADAPIAPPERRALLDALGLEEEEICHAARNAFDALVHLADPARLAGIAPDFQALARLPCRGTILTAAGRPGGRDCDFLSRFFAPAAGINEDPVTGSAHCALSPYWSALLGREQLTGYQASARGGFVHTRLAPPRVRLGGRAVTVFRARTSLLPA